MGLSVTSFWIDYYTIITAGECAAVSISDSRGVCGTFLYRYFSFSFHPKQTLLSVTPQISSRSDRPPTPHPPPPAPSHRAELPDCAYPGPLALISVLASSCGHWHEKRLRNEDSGGGDKERAQGQRGEDAIKRAGHKSRCQASV